MSDDLAARVAEHYARTRERLAERGFHGRVGFGERPALLVIDLARAFTDPSSPLGADLDAQVAASAILLDAAHAARVPVVLTTIGYSPALDDAGVWRHKIPSSSLLVEGSEWVEIDPRLGRREHDQVLVKKYASCFFGTDLASRLVSRGVDTLLIAGCTTSGCVRASAVDACSLGLRVAVVEEAVGDREPVSHLASLYDIDCKYGDVVSLEEATGYLHRVGTRA